MFLFCICSGFNFNAIIQVTINFNLILYFIKIFRSDNFLRFQISKIK